MRCIDRGAGMRLVKVVGDPTMMVRGFEHHTFECAACRGIERRRVFTRVGRSPTGRIVRIDPDVSQANYFARDCKSGQIVLQNQNRERLWELCNWLGWRVTDDSPPQQRLD
jgi:hypothetical protein